MAIRTILAPLSGGAASEGAIETACRLAKRFGAHLEALHMRVDPREALPLLGQSISSPVASELIELATLESTENARRARAAFDAAVERHGLPLRAVPLGSTERTREGGSASWREETGYAAAFIPRRARIFDLVVLGQSGRVSDRPHSNTLEETLLRGGRPVLVAPMRPALPIGEIVAIAWNHSLEAARAVAAAMPLLSEAKEVHLLLASREGEQPSAGDLAEYLAWHGIRSAAHVIDLVPGLGAGELLLEAARDHGADLLVMGGYGHAPWREMIFGGTTRQIVGNSRLPLLLAH
ncbi:MAG TPA: universal stress protein [Stellaceae bacterium]|nr:universal stress protein [Stellaceae bacterium]